MMEHAREKGLEIPGADEFKSIPGKGAYGKMAGKEVYVGGPNLLEA